MDIQKILRSLILLGAILITINLSAQQSNTLYFMRGVPQVYQMNPAIQPDCNFFLGLPGFSPMQVRVDNSTFGFSDLVSYNESIDSLITFLHPLADKDAFLDLLKERNYLNTEYGISIGSFGFRINKAFLSFDIATRGNVRVGYPGDMLKIPVNGIESDMNYNFNGLGINTTLWNEFAIGFSLKPVEQLSIGVRGKFLQGLMNIEMQKFDVQLSTANDVWDIHSDILMNASLPAFNLELDEDGMIDLNSLELLDFPKELPSLLTNFNNKGFAMDIGADFRPLDWLQTSISLVDFGRINWRDKVYNIQNKADYSFSGVEINLDNDDFLDVLADTLKQLAEFSASENAYSSWLTPKLYTGVNLYAHPKISFGILSRTEFIPQSVRQQFTFSANFYPIRMLSASFSYSILEGTYQNIGLGISLKAGPFNLYVITDTGPSVAFWPYDTRYFNIRSGLNIAVGGKKIKREPKYSIPFSP
jgi:hypothetical protein